jgi:hypothetical protein
MLKIIILIQTYQIIMKNKIALSILLTIASIQVSADYLIKIQLDPQGINIDLPSEISGTAQLEPSTINRGESSTISWSYDYANEVNNSAINYRAFSFLKPNSDSKLSKFNFFG